MEKGWFSGVVGFIAHGLPRMAGNLVGAPIPLKTGPVCFPLLSQTFRNLPFCLDGEAFEKTKPSGWLEHGQCVPKCPRFQMKMERAIEK